MGGCNNAAKTADRQSTQCPTEPEDLRWSSRPEDDQYSRPTPNLLNLVLWPLPCDWWLAAALALILPHTPVLTCQEPDWCGLSSSQFVQLHPGTSAWTLQANQCLYLCSCSVHVVCLLFYGAMRNPQSGSGTSLFIFHLVRCTRFRRAVYLHLCSVKCWIGQMLRIYFLVCFNF